ncbi:MAG: hypothetical protein WEC59_06250 [Salibacteraceae bacterium]
MGGAISGDANYYDNYYVVSMSPVAGVFFSKSLFAGCYYSLSGTYILSQKRLISNSGYGLGARYYFNFKEKLSLWPEVVTEYLVNPTYTRDNGFAVSSGIGMNYWLSDRSGLEVRTGIKLFDTLDEDLPITLPTIRIGFVVLLNNPPS